MAPLCHIILGDLSRDIIVCKVLWYFLSKYQDWRVLTKIVLVYFWFPKQGLGLEVMQFGFDQKHFRFCSLETSGRALEKTIKLKFKYIQIPLMRDHKMFVKWMMALAPGSLPCEASSAQSPATLQPPKHPSLTLIARNGHPSDHFYLTDTIGAQFSIQLVDRVTYIKVNPDISQIFQFLNSI